MGAASAAPYVVSNLRHGWKAVPFQTRTLKVFAQPLSIHTRTTTSPVLSGGKLTTRKSMTHKNLQMTVA
jgi:hypothetical protein